MPNQKISKRKKIIKPKMSFNPGNLMFEPELPLSKSDKKPRLLKPLIILVILLIILTAIYWLFFILPGISK